MRLATESMIRNVTAGRTTMRGMAMGKRQPDRQPTLWVVTTDLPTAASHPFYTRLNQLLHEHGFDDFAEVRCARTFSTSSGSFDSLNVSLRCGCNPNVRQMRLMAM